MKSNNSSKFAMVAVHLGTGEIIYDISEDNVTNSELQTRLTLLKPSEILLPPMTSSQANGLKNNVLFTLTGGQRWKFFS